MTTAEAVILAIVEGLTEFLPISSTGHLILTESLMKLDATKSLKVFTITIQLGAILSVMILYWRRFLQSFDFYLKLLVAFIPAAIIGVLLHDKIEGLLSSVYTVAISFIVGGVILIVIDFVYRQSIEDAANDDDTESVNYIDEFGIERKKDVLKKMNVSWTQAFVIGCFQCLGMIPGVSRAGATIVGGLVQKLNIKRAAEFSFFLAVPTIFGATAVELKKNFSYIRGEDITTMIIGIIVSFVVGMLAIRLFIGLITRFGLKFFGLYRIILGVLIFVLIGMGVEIKMKDSKEKPKNELPAGGNFTTQ